MRQHDYVSWHHIPTEDNPANLGSRGNVVNNHLWNHSPTWLSDTAKWPPDIILKPTPETMTEAKVKLEVLSVTIPKQDGLQHVLISHPLPRGLRFGSWVWRFIHNCREQPKKRSGPISTEEIQQQKLF